MMSQMVMSRSTTRSCPSIGSRSSFFVTRVPIVVRYCSSNMSMTYRRIKEVFPTAFSPTRQTFDLSRFVFVIYRLALGTAARLRRRLLNDWRVVLLADSRRDRNAFPLKDHRPEPSEERLHVLPRLRRGVEIRCLERPRRLLDLSIPVQDHDLVFQVDLVDRVDDRDLADDVEHALHPVVQLLEGGVPREIADRDHSFCAVEERLLEEVAEPLLPHDVPDRHVHVDLRAVRGPELHLPLRDFRAQGRDVAVVELVLDEPSDQGRLADRGLADEADFRLDSLGLGHRGHRPIRLRLLKGSAGRTSRRKLFA